MSFCCCCWEKVSNMMRHHVGWLPDSFTEFDDDSQQVPVLGWCSLQIIWTAKTVKLIQSQKRVTHQQTLVPLKAICADHSKSCTCFATVEWQKCPCQKGGHEVFRCSWGMKAKHVSCLFCSFVKIPLAFGFTQCAVAWNHTLKKWGEWVWCCQGCILKCRILLFFLGIWKATHDPPLLFQHVGV